MKKMLFLALVVIGGCFIVNFQASASRSIDSNSEFRRLQPGESFLACFSASGNYSDHVKSILEYMNRRLSFEQTTVVPYTVVGTEASAEGIHHSTEMHGEAVIVRKPYQVEYMQPTFPDEKVLFCAAVRKM